MRTICHRAWHNPPRSLHISKLRHLQINGHTIERHYWQGEHAAGDHYAACDFAINRSAPSKFVVVRCKVNARTPSVSRRNVSLDRMIGGNISWYWDRSDLMRN
jgi:hypothetical protein